MSDGDNSHYRGIYVFRQPEAAKLCKEDIRGLYKLLKNQADEALEKHISQVKKNVPEGTPEPQVEDLVDKIRRAGQLRALVYGASGEQLIASSIEVLTDDALPRRLASVTYNSAAGLEPHFPINRFTVILDFTEPPVLGAYNPWDEPTPNNSKVEIVGNDATWVKGTDAQISSYLQERGSSRRWLHTTETYNILHWFVSFPLSFWFVYRVDIHFRDWLTQIPVVLAGGIYVYLILVSFLVIRTLFGVIRWAFPLFEVENSPSAGARKLVVVLCVSVAGSVGWDIVKHLSR